MTKPSPVKVRGVHHFAISVPCLTEAIKFYSEAFGFELVDHEHLAPSDEADRVTQLQGTDTTVAMLRAGNLFIELFEFHSPAPKALNGRLNDFGITHFSFEVESVHEAYDLLKAHGVSWHSEPIDAGDGYLMTYGQDPFGNVLEIQQVPAERSYSLEKLSLK